MRIEPTAIHNHPGYRVWENTQELGTIETYENVFHSGNCYLKLHLRQYPEAGPLFAQLRETIGRPLQVMLPSTDSNLSVFLKAGGFQCARRCFEMEVSQADLQVKYTNQVPFRQCRKGETEYGACCELLYTVYARNHEAINPLTADFDTFCELVPETVFYQVEGGRVARFAFTEENEIAYVGSLDGKRFPTFLLSVLAELFEQYETVCFECDDSDKAAMALRDLFVADDTESFDTYIYK